MTFTLWNVLRNGPFIFWTFYILWHFMFGRVSCNVTFMFWKCYFSNCPILTSHILRNVVYLWRSRCVPQTFVLHTNYNPGGLVANMTSKKQNCGVKFIIHKKNWKNFFLKSSISVLCLILYKQVFTKIMSCLIILSICPDLCLFWGSVQMHSGRHAVDIDFQPLGLNIDCKEGRGGGFWGPKN